MYNLSLSMPHAKGNFYEGSGFCIFVYPSA